MEFTLVLLLVTIVKVQGYYKDLNGTILNKYSYIGVLSDDKHEKELNKEEFDNVFQHYRSDGHRREPRFVSFQTKDDHIDVEIDFAIPFLSIPVKRSLSGVMGTLNNVIKVSCMDLNFV